MDHHDAELLNGVETPVFVLESDSRGLPVFASFNDAACRLVNFSAEQALGKTAEEVYQGELGKVIFQRHVSVMQSGEAKTFELQFPIEGRIRHIRTHLKPVTSDSGEVARIIGTVKEVTAEYELQDERSRTMSVTRELEAFISLAAHDLRSPLRNVKALSGMLQDGFTDLGDGKLQVIQKLDQVANQALVLISDVLDHAEATGATESVERFELDVLCRDILIMLDPTGRHVVTIDSRSVHADKTATQIVLRNLIDNAIKHNAGKPIALHVSATTLYEGFFQITVSDDGVGFDESTVRFLNGAEQRPGNGYGLLGIRSLLKSRGGSLNAEAPMSGRGAVVRFALPGTLDGDDDQGADS
ncbi:ATP-binding protein [Granulosicoccus sp. 3-233]|uniref:ATP-binding protein n=1 Tax=Granulosicoccus sp. 3-233 TaxID=3417969 RepID=UPI003D3555E6